MCQIQILSPREITSLIIGFLLYLLPATANISSLQYLSAYYIEQSKCTDFYKYFAGWVRVVRVSSRMKALL